MSSTSVISTLSCNAVSQSYAFKVGQGKLKDAFFSVFIDKVEARLKNAERFATD